MCNTLKKPIRAFGQQGIATFFAFALIDAKHQRIGGHLYASRSGQSRTRLHERRHVGRRKGPARGVCVRCDLQANRQRHPGKLRVWISDLARPRERILLPRDGQSVRHLFSRQSFNPCSVGCAELIVSFAAFLAPVRGFNPCSVGCAELIIAAPTPHPHPCVSILVLLDVLS